MKLYVQGGTWAWDRGLRQGDSFETLAEPANNTGRLKSSKEKVPVSLVKEPEVQSREHLLAKHLLGTQREM